MAFFVTSPGCVEIGDREVVWVWRYILRESGGWLSFPIFHHCGASVPTNIAIMKPFRIMKTASWSEDDTL